MRPRTQTHRDHGDNLRLSQRKTTMVAVSSPATVGTATVEVEGRGR